MDIKETDAGVLLTVRVSPNASRNAIVRTESGILGIRLTTPPVEGKANKHLLKFLAKQLKIAPSLISIVRGHGSREKTLLISGLDGDALRERLGLDEPPRHQEGELQGGEDNEPPRHQDTKRTNRSRRG